MEDDPSAPNMAITVLKLPILNAEKKRDEAHN
jgi:hypothetical protein